MKRNLTRVLSMLLAVLFCLSAVPTQAYAVGTESGIVIGDGSGSTPDINWPKDDGSGYEIWSPETPEEGSPIQQPETPPIIIGGNGDNEGEDDPSSNPGEPGTETITPTTPNDSNEGYDPSKDTDPDKDFDISGLSPDVPGASTTEEGPIKNDTSNLEIEGDEPDSFIDKVVNFFTGNGEDPSKGKWSFSVKYVGQSNPYNVDMKSNFTLKYQVNFHNDLDTLETGVVQIRVPEALYSGEQSGRRDGSKVIPSSIGVPQGHPDTWKESESYSSRSPFNWYRDGEDLVFWNYREIPSGTTVAFQVLYSAQNLLDVYDGSSWELQPSIDITRWTITGTPTQDSEGNEIPNITEGSSHALSTPLTGSVDSSVRLEKATITSLKDAEKQYYTPGLYTENQVKQYISGALPTQYAGENFKNYYFVAWKADASVAGNQAWSYQLNLNSYMQDGDTQAQGTVVGFRPYSFRFDGNYATSNFVLNGNTLTSGPNTKKSMSETLYIVMAYPKAGISEESSVHMSQRSTLVPADGLDTPVASTNSVSWDYSPYRWKYEGSGIGINKYIYDIHKSPLKSTTNATAAGWTTIYNAAKALGEDLQLVDYFYAYGYIRGWDYTTYTDTNSPNVGQYKGGYYSLSVGDDVVYAWEESNTSNKVLLDGSDYYFDKVVLYSNTAGYDIDEAKTTTPTLAKDMASANRDIIVQAMYAENGTQSDQWVTVTTVPWEDDGSITYTFTEDQLAKKPYRVRAVQNCVDYSVSLSWNVSMTMRHDSPKLAALLRSGENLCIENLNSVTGYVKPASGNGYNLVDGTTGSGSKIGYASYTAAQGYQTDLTSLTSQLYSGMPTELGWSNWTYKPVMRQRAIVSTSPVEEHAIGYKSNSMVNDPQHGRILIDYNLVGVESYEVERSVDATYLKRNAGEVSLGMPKRSEVKMYDLLPFGVNYDPTVQPKAGRITRGLPYSSFSSYKQWDATQVSVEMTHYEKNYKGTGRNLVEFTLTYTGSDASVLSGGNWYQGFGVYFRAWASWEAVPNRDDVSNIAAYIPSGDRVLGTYGTTNSEVSYDNGVVSSDSFAVRSAVTGRDGKSLFGSDINKDGITNVPNVVYMARSLFDDFATSYEGTVATYVRAESDNYNTPAKSAIIAHEEGYTYSINAIASDGTTMSDIVLFDRLEDLTINSEWRGIFKGVNTASAENAGATNVTVWYNVSSDAILPGNATGADISSILSNTAATGWYDEATWKSMGKTEADVKSVAVQLGGLTLKDGKSCSIEIEMVAPPAADGMYGTVYNQSHMYATVSQSGATAQTALHDSNTVSVEIANNYTVEIIKEFKDPSGVPNSLREEEFLMTLRMASEEEKDGKVLSYQEYDVYEQQGEEWVYVETGFTNLSGVLYLKAGQKAVFSIAGGTRLQVEEEASVYWDTEYQSELNTEDSIMTYKVINAYRPVLYMQKNCAAVPANTDLSNEVFTFQVELWDREAGDYVPAAGYNYQYVTSARTDGVVPSKANRTPNEGTTGADGTVQLKNGDIVALFADYSGQKFRVTEVIPEDKGTTKWNWVCEEPQTEGTLGVYGAKSSITNYYRWKTLYIYKEFEHQTREEAVKVGATFKFLLTTEDGVSVSLFYFRNHGSTYDYVRLTNGVYSLTAGDYIQILKLEAGKTYTLQEVNVPENYACLTAPQTFKMSLYTSSREVTFTNEWLRRDLKVSKTVIKDPNSTEEVDPNQTYPIEVVIPRNTSTLKFTRYYSDGSTVNGAVGVSDNGTRFTLHLKDGESVIVWDIGCKGDVISTAEIDAGGLTQIYPEAGGSIEVTLQDDEEKNVANFINGQGSFLILNKEWLPEDPDDAQDVDAAMDYAHGGAGIIAHIELGGMPYASQTYYVLSGGEVITSVSSNQGNVTVCAGDPVYVPLADSDTAYTIEEVVADRWSVSYASPTASAPIRQAFLIHAYAEQAFFEGTVGEQPFVTFRNYVDRVIVPDSFVIKQMTNDSEPVPDGAILTYLALFKTKPAVDLDYYVCYCTETSAVNSIFTYNGKHYIPGPNLRRSVQSTVAQSNQSPQGVLATAENSEAVESYIRDANMADEMVPYSQGRTLSLSSSKNTEKLSPGYKPDSAGDDSAGLSISDRQAGQITVLGSSLNDYVVHGKVDSEGRIYIEAREGLTPIVFFGHGFGVQYSSSYITDRVVVTEDINRTSLEWGTLVAVTGGDSKLVFINSNAKVPLRIEKQLASGETSLEDFTFGFTPVPTNVDQIDGESSYGVSGGYLELGSREYPYTIYDIATGAVVREGTTVYAGRNSYGFENSESLSLKAGQYAEVMVDSHALYIMSEYENSSNFQLDHYTLNGDCHIARESPGYLLFQVGDPYEEISYTVDKRTFDGDPREGWTVGDMFTQRNYVVSKYVNGALAQVLTALDYELLYTDNYPHDETHKFTQVITITETGEKLYVEEELTELDVTIVNVNDDSRHGYGDRGMRYLFSTCTLDGKITLGSGIKLTSISSYFPVISGRSLVFDLGGNSLTFAIYPCRCAAFVVEGDLALVNSKDTGVLKGCSSSEISGLMMVRSGGSLLIENVTIESPAEVDDTEGSRAIHLGTDTVLSLENTTISNFTANSGAAVYAKEGSTVDFISGTIQNCTATVSKTYGGGGIYGYKADIYLGSGASIKSCTAVCGGGAIYNHISSLVMDADAEIVSCSAKYGGAIYESGAGSITTTTTIAGTISNCTATDYAGGIYCSGSATSLLLQGDATISECRALASGSGGGAISLHYGAVATVTGNATITDCSAYNGGGINVHAEDCVLELSENAKIQDCTCVASGGGINVKVAGANVRLSDQVSVARCKSMSAQGSSSMNCRGGGIFNGGTCIIVDTVTITDCYTEYYGGGIYNGSDLSVYGDAGILRCESRSFGGGIYNVNTARLFDRVILDSCDAGYGGGITNNAGATLNIGGNVSIVNCTAKSMGGGISGSGNILLGEFSLISNCSAGSGGGCSVNNPCTITMDGNSIIESCIATLSPQGSGGGIRSSSANIVMRGFAVIRECRAAYGGGIAVTDTASTSPTLSMSGDAEVSGCSADKNGGGVQIADCVMSMAETSAIRDCCASGSGGGVFMTNYRSELSLRGHSGIYSCTDYRGVNSIAANRASLPINLYDQCDVNAATIISGTLVDSRG